MQTVPSCAPEALGGRPARRCVAAAVDRSGRGAEQLDQLLIEEVGAREAIEEDQMRVEAGSPERALEVEAQAVASTGQQREDGRESAVDLEIDHGVRAEQLAPGPQRRPQQARKTGVVDHDQAVEEVQRLGERHHAGSTEQAQLAVRVAFAQTEQGWKGDHQAATPEQLEDADPRTDTQGVIAPQEPAQQQHRGTQQNDEHTARNPVDPLLPAQIHALLRRSARRSGGSTRDSIAVPSGQAREGAGAGARVSE